MAAAAPATPPLALATPPPAPAPPVDAVSPRGLTIPVPGHTAKLSGPARVWRALVSLPFGSVAELFSFLYLVVSLPVYFVRFPTATEDVGMFVLHLALIPAIPGIRAVFGSARKRGTFLAAALDLYPVALFVVLYSEIAVLNQRIWGGRFFDTTVAGWEEALFGLQVSQEMRHWLGAGTTPGRILGEYLHFAYFAYYGVIFSLPFVLYRNARTPEGIAAFRKATGTVCLSFYVGFCIFMLFPVEGPWWHLSPPEPADVGYVMSHVVSWLVSGGSANGTAFPSTHTSISITCWILAYRHNRSLFVGYFFIVPGLILATMFGGFHYGVDVLAGTVMGLLAGTLGYSLTTRVHDWLAQRETDYITLDDFEDKDAVELV